jgi:hypothetical protein
MLTDDISFRECPHFFRSCGDYVKGMLELIKYREKIFQYKLFSKGEEIPENSMTHYLNGMYSIDIYENVRINQWSEKTEQKAKSYLFTDILNMFYKEYPEIILSDKIEEVITNNKKVHDILDELRNDQSKLIKKVQTMEQFQAQILDKLTIFADMIDEIQSGLKTI